jgi:hypothetical protein
VDQTIENKSRSTMTQEIQRVDARNELEKEIVNLSNQELENQNGYRQKKLKIQTINAFRRAMT